MKNLTILLITCVLFQSCIILPKNTYEPFESSIPNKFEIHSRCGGFSKSYHYNGSGNFDLDFKQTGKSLEVHIFFRGVKGSSFIIRKNAIRYKFARNDWTSVDSKLFFYSTTAKFKGQQLESLDEHYENLELNKSYAFGEEFVLFKVEMPNLEEDLEIEIPSIENKMEQDLPKTLKYLWNGRWTVFPINGC